MLSELLQYPSKGKKEGKKEGNLTARRLSVGEPNDLLPVVLYIS